MGIALEIVSAAMKTPRSVVGSSVGSRTASRESGTPCDVDAMV
jgi:hypothetical protein